ncbi:MAG: MtrB/PioB family outer membrane beta-barrel protein [Desulfocapsaceae bacterium]|nr:MtrB/PioB family outer membrane beta-barrel protein [Desulfocapsaceae bacterium]
MIKKIYSAVVLLALVAPGTVFAAEEAADVHGSIELGGRGVDNNTNSAKFEEFVDMSDGVFGQVQLDAFMGDYFLQFDTTNPGNDDQSYQLKGGDYGVFKYKFSYDEMPHNYTFDAITPATGIGTQHITFPDTTSPAIPPLSQWTSFDYKVNHKSYGGELEFSLNSPFYAKLGAEKREEDGLRPYSVKQPAEVPEPISSTTDNLFLKGGYLGESLSVSLTGLLSSYKNDHKYMLWDDPDDHTTDLVVFSPDNDFKKLAGDLSWRDLPLQSMLAIGGSYAHLTNSYNANDIGFDTTNSTIFQRLIEPYNRLTFDGDIDFTSASVALTSRPLDKLDTKLYYRYFERDNNSSIISYTSVPRSGSPEETSNNDELLSYQKDDAGIDLDYRLPGRTKLEGGYEYLNMDRSSPAGDAITTNKTVDNSVYIGIKNSTLDWVTAKLRYKYLNRDSADREAPTLFYYQNQSVDEWKMGLDFYPVDSLDLGISYTYKDIDYDYSVDSRQQDTRNNVYLDATWRASTIASFTGFVGFEQVETDANRVTDNQTSPVYAQTIDDDFWSYGLAAKVAATEKLTFNLSWQYQKSDGAVNFDNSLTNSNYQDIVESDDYTQHVLEAKATYAVDQKLGVTIGYIYKKLDYSDINYANYTNVLDTTYYYSGLYADPNYEANIGYLLVAYKF